MANATAMANAKTIAKSETPEARRERNAEPANREARREYMHSAAGRAANRKAQASYKHAHPERVAAQHHARSAHGESGDSGHKCARCEKPAKHKHHSAGYGGSADTKISWLCHDHHVRAHHPKSDLGKAGLVNDAFANGDGTSSPVTSLRLSVGRTLPDSTPRMRAFAKHMGPFEANWYESYRETPFFHEAVKLEQSHMRHEVDRRAKEQASMAARREREHAEDKQNNIWAWDSAFYADHQAKIADMKRRHLDWLASSTGKDGFSKPIAKSKNQKQEQENNMSNEVFDQIMKGGAFGQTSAIARGAGAGAGADRASLEAALVVAETGYTKSMQAAADAGIALALHKGDKPNPFASGKFKPFGKKDGDGEDDKDASAKDDGDAKDPDEKKPNPFAKKSGAGQGGFGGRPEAKTVDASETEAATKSVAELKDEVTKSYRAAEAFRLKAAALKKALSTIEHGEAGMGADTAIGAAQTESSVGASSVDTGADEPFGSLGSMNGMPSPDAGAEITLSDDDYGLAEGQSAIERVVPHGSAELEALVNKTEGGDAGGAGGSMAKSAGGGRGQATQHGGAYDISHAAGRAAYVAQFSKAEPVSGLNLSLGGAPARAAADPNVGASWSNGMVTYSNNEDLRITGLMNKSDGTSASSGVYGGVIAEPTLDMRAPLLKSRVCNSCRQPVPAMFSNCPNCGVSHGGSAGEVHALLLSKSVSDDLDRRRAVPDSVHMFDGALSLGD